MKKTSGIIGGFAFGMIGFLLLFKVIILDNTSPSDELAPGVVVFAAIVTGLLFAFAVHSLQKRIEKKAKTTESE